MLAIQPLRGLQEIRLSLRKIIALAQGQPKWRILIVDDDAHNRELLRHYLMPIGFEVRQVKVEDGCYEVYGIKDGKKVEAIFNPATGEQVGAE